jgi:hypothetical protein
MRGDSQADLLSWRPSHEETPEHFKRTPDGPRDFTGEWHRFAAEHPLIAERIEWEALVEKQAGAKRISVDDLWNRARKALGVTLNNDHRAACARWLLDRQPSLRGLIRTRATTRTR